MGERRNTVLVANEIIIESYARGYYSALWSHWTGNENGFDCEAFNYITQQASFCMHFPKEVCQFLEFRGVEKICVHHLQYFFAIEPPVYEPYMELWAYVCDRLSEEDLMPTRGEDTLARLLSDGKNNHKRPLCK